VEHVGIIRILTRHRLGLMFYEMDWYDPAGSSPWKRSTDGVYDGTFEGDMNILSEVTKEMDPDAELVTEVYIDEDAAKAPKLEAVSKVNLAVEKANLLPDGYARTPWPCDCTS
jgi:hypothetical protein